MPNVNIVSSENLTGDISSCRTEVAIIGGTSRPSLFHKIDTGYATNNCTGQTDVYHSWDLTGFSWILIVLIASIVFLGAVRLIFRD